MTQLNHSPQEEHSVTKSGSSDAMARNAIWGASLLTVAGLLFSLVGFMIAEINSWKDYFLLGAPILLFILGLISIVMLLRGRLVSGTALIFVANLIVPVVETALQKHIGTAVFAYTLVSSALLIWRTLPKSSRRWASTLTAFVLLSILVIELVDSPIRVNPANELVATIIVATTLLTVSFIVQAIRETWGLSMRNKLMAALIGSTLVTAGILSVYMFISTTNILRQGLERELAQHTDGVAKEISALFDEQVASLTTLSLNETLQQSAKDANDSYEGDASAIQVTLKARDEQWQAADAADNNNDPLVQRSLYNLSSQELLEFRNVFPNHVEVFITDVYGGLVATTSRTSDYYQADEVWWQVAYNNGQGAVYISEPKYDQSAGIFAIQMALPIRYKRTNQLVGIMRTTYQTSAITPILGEVVGKTGETALYIPGRPAFIFHQGQLDPMDPDEVNKLQALVGQGMVEMDYEDESATSNSATANSKVPSVVIQTSMKELEADTEFNKLGWVVLYHQSQDEAYAPINTAIQGAVLVLAIVVFLAVAGAYALSQLLVRPITQLTQIAEGVANGDLNSRAEVNSTDEIGTLAGTFNRMTQQLRDFINTLESRVAERTRNLELAAEVGRTVSQVRALDVMLTEAAELIRKQFDLYYVQVYLVNPSQTYLNLQAGTGKVGKELLGRNHRLPFNADSVNGRAALEKKSVVISNTTLSDTFKPNPLLPNTRSEMAVPLLVGDRVVGVLDMQSENTGALSPDILPAFEALAGQMAIAIQNANFLAETQQARSQVEAQAKRLSRANWADYLDAIHKPEETGFVFEQNQVLPLTEDVEVKENALVVPLSVTGEELGNLVIELEGQSPIARTDELLAAVARQVSQQIENLRLLESAERYRLDAEEASRRLTREGWKEFTERTNEGLSFRYDLKEVRPQNEDGDPQVDGLALPIKVRDEAIGKLVVQGMEADDTESLTLASTVAERLAAHIEGLRQFSQTQSALAQSEKMFQASSVLNQAKALSEITSSTVRLLGIPEINRALLVSFNYGTENNIESLDVIANWWNGSGHEVTPVGTHYSQQVIRVMPMFVSPVPVFFNDTHVDPRVDARTMELVKRLNLRAVAVLPLHAGSQQIGALILEAEEPHNFTQEETRLFSALAPQIATVLDNRLQYERAQRQADRESKLNAISQKIQSATTVEAVLQIAARELGHTLGAPLTIAQLGLKDNANN